MGVKTLKLAGTLSVIIIDSAFQLLCFYNDRLKVDAECIGNLKEIVRDPI